MDFCGMKQGYGTAGSVPEGGKCKILPGEREKPTGSLDPEFLLVYNTWEGQEIN